MKYNYKKIYAVALFIIVGCFCIACGQEIQNDNNDVEKEIGETESIEEELSENSNGVDNVTDEGTESYGIKENELTTEINIYSNPCIIREWTEDFVPASEEYWCLWLVADELKLDDYTDVYGNEHLSCDLIMPEEAIQDAMCAANTYQDMIYKLSAGRANVNVATYELKGQDEILNNSIYFEDYNFFSPEVLPEKVKQICADYDYIMIIAPTSESVCYAGGLTIPDIIGIACDNGSYYETTSSYLPLYVDGYDKDSFDVDYFVECCVHEWLHTFERFDGQYGCNIPNQSVIDCSSDYGYEAENDSFYNYYADFMLGKINGNIGMTEEAWKNININ